MPETCFSFYPEAWQHSCQLLPSGLFSFQKGASRRCSVGRFNPWAYQSVAFMSPLGTKHQNFQHKLRFWREPPSLCMSLHPPSQAHVGGCWWLYDLMMVHTHPKTASQMWIQTFFVEKMHTPLKKKINNNDFVSRFMFKLISCLVLDIDNAVWTYRFLLPWITSFDSKTIPASCHGTVDQTTRLCLEWCFTKGHPNIYLQTKLILPQKCSPVQLKHAYTYTWILHLYIYTLSIS